MKDASTLSCGHSKGEILELVAYDDTLGYYTDLNHDSITTVRLDRKKLTKHDKRKARQQIAFLFDHERIGTC